jgi:hypothetical protein
MPPSSKRVKERPMKPKAMFPSHPRPDAADAVTIRMAAPADAAALSRLAELDSAPQLEPVPALVAEVRGELHAALAIDSGRAIADPFEPTAELVAMLAQRAEQLAAAQAPRRPVRRLRLPRAARAAHAHRA